MKIYKIFQNLFLHNRVQKTEKSIPTCPITYNRKNVTAGEFKKYINWLAENNINKTFHEPDRFVTEAERKNMDEFKKQINYLAQNNIGTTFIA